jgi:glutamate-1-semialdehyde 2,1-aminomutase
MTMSTIKELENEYVRTHSKSQQLYQRALTHFASGVTHDARFAKPFPIYATHTSGSRKWDVDGNEYVDYVMGHGTLILGYGDARVLTAFQEQIPKAIHMGTSTELEIEWAALLKQLVPAARNGWIRATSCGSEAVAMAIRLSRVYTRRNKIVIQAGCYHGKGDNTLLAYHGPPFGFCNAEGIPRGVKDDVIIVPFNNLDAIESALKTGDVAVVLLHCNNLYTKEYLIGLRKLTQQYGAVFLMDEVISGFRFAAGGAQEYYGVTPDITTLGKVPGGGAPIGVICGKKEILDFYSFKDAHWNQFTRIASGGTWNAQPLCIAGGIAMMKILLQERDKIYPRLYEIGKRLTNSFNQQAESLNVAALASGYPYEAPTLFNIHFLHTPLRPEHQYLWQTGPTSFEDYYVKTQYSSNPQASYVNYLVMANSGIHPFASTSFFTCATYTEDDLQKTEAAFGKSLRILKENKLIGQLR